MADKKFGVAFSGGGIRSAAFCSGVLRRLITKKKEPDFLSCVSGGGYTGSAYVQWKYFKGDPANWADKFFDDMRARTGHFCNWQNCWQGIVDSCVLGCLLLLVALTAFFGWFFSFAFPIAFVVNFLYGQFLDGTRCSQKADTIDCNERTILFIVSISIFVLFHVMEYCCEDKDTYLATKAPKAVLKLGQLISGATFAFTFFPWFIDDFLRYTNVWIRLSIIGMTALFWFFIPIMRKYSSLVILIYAYSYVVYWRVYKGMLLIEYTEKKFKYFLSVSLVVLALLSILGDFPQRLVYIYNRWRLQKAFYHKKEDPGYCYDCSEENCHCYDCSPGGHCCCCCACPPVCCSCPPDVPVIDPEKKIKVGNRALTLGDIDVEALDDKKPLYISNIVANNWSRDCKQKYCVLTMSPKGISVINEQPTARSVRTNNDQTNDGASTSDATSRPSQDHVAVDIENDDTQLTEAFIKRCLSSDHFNGKLKPSDIKLSSAMAMSAAAVSPYLGKNEEIERQFTHILTICGIEMAANTVYDMDSERNEHCCGPISLYCINILIFAVLFVPGVYIAVVEISFLDYSWPVEITECTAGIILGGLFVLFIILLIPKCQKLSTCLQTFSEAKIFRWCIVHVPIYRFIRSILSIITYGETPPAMMHLSDGGHFENYGLLPLLKLRLPKILVVDGSEIKSDDDYARDIIAAMEHARKLFNCSFTSMAGNDVLNDIEEKYGKDVLDHIRKHNCGNVVLNYIKNKLGGDVLTDITKKFVEKRSRIYEFKVHYPKDDENQMRASEGHIVLIAPRRPEEDDASRGDTNHSNQWEDIEMPELNREAEKWWKTTAKTPTGSSGESKARGYNVETSMDFEKWGRGPFLTQDDIKFIEGCPRGIGCCQCCHRCKPCGSCWFQFPRHPTANQFYTPQLFSAYHREGYRACMECDDFLKRSTIE